MVSLDLCRFGTSGRPKTADRSEHMLAEMACHLDYQLRQVVDSAFWKSQLNMEALRKPKAPDDPLDHRIHPVT